MLTIRLYFNGPYGAEYHEASLPIELCKPNCLVAAAVSANALFATCPAKYGGRQFTNPNKLPKKLAQPNSAQNTPSEARRKAGGK